MHVLRVLADACGPSLIDVHADRDHHRSVFTLAGPGPRDACAGARQLASAVAAHLSIVGHEGEHPRVGVLDVVPFVALGGTNTERAQAVAARFGIRSIPTMIVFRGGREVARTAGAMDARSIRAWIESQVSAA